MLNMIIIFNNVAMISVGIFAHFQNPYSAFRALPFPFFSLISSFRLNKIQKMADSNIAWLSNLGTGPEPTEDKHFLRKTSIIATIGLFI